VSLRPETLPLAHAAGVTILRYPGGAWGDNNKLQTYQIDQLVDLARDMGAEPYIHVRFPNSTPEEAAAIVRYANLDKDYGVRYWSIGNEPSLYEGAGLPWTAALYAEEWRKFADAMKAVDPTIVLVGPEIHQFTGTPNVDPKDSTGADWMRTFLQIAGDKVDIVSFHRYPFPATAERRSATVAELRADAATWDDIVRRLRDVIREETGRDLPVAVTEFNSHWSQAIRGEATPDSHFSAIWLGDILGRLIRQRIELATHFLLVSGAESGFGLLEKYGPRPAYFTYQMYKMFGDELLYAASDDPTVSIYAARRDDGALTLMAVNLNDEAVTRPLALTGFTPRGDAEVYRFDATVNAEQVENVTLTDGGELTLPPQSLTLYIVK
jgi:alpha-L-arabinofuranosidase